LVKYHNIGVHACPNWLMLTRNYIVKLFVMHTVKATKNWRKQLNHFERIWWAPNSEKQALWAADCRSDNGEGRPHASCHRVGSDTILSALAFGALRMMSMISKSLKVMNRKLIYVWLILFVKT